ncbi:sporulation protein [Kitasatospora camelliae]|uniref:Sporulation protein n=1 Tax=Kitasatospora camelliae TaxID=3156397 RepID=A0AAU8JWK3_9ACTN
MVFKKLLGALGVGGPTVDTVLSTPVVRPGGQIQGQVNLVGGKQDAEITGITLTLVARVEIEHEEGESSGLSPFARFSVTPPLRLAEGEQRSVPFSVQLPHEAPITVFDGWQPHGMAVGVRTEVEIAGARDKGDADPLGIAPLPVQERVLQAFTALGFRLHSADLEAGHIRGSAQSLPFYQEIEYAVPSPYSHLGRMAEITFVTTPQQVEVVLEFDKRHGDVINRHLLDHSAAEHDLTPVVEDWLRHAVSSSHGHGYGGHGHGGAGVAAGVAAGAVAGVVGGLVLEELVEDVVEDVFEDAVEDFFED